MADILSEQFKSVFTAPLKDKSILNPNDFFSIQIDTTQPSITDVEFTEDDILNALQETNPRSTHDPDVIPSYLLHHYRHYLNLCTKYGDSHLIKGKCRMPQI